MSDQGPAAELGDFLRARRGEVGPAEVGLPVGERRRVQGLRREEVAMLAAISTDYYTRIEQGRRPASEGVLEAIAKVLRLDRDQRDYAFDLARAAAAAAPRRASRPRSGTDRVPAGIQAMIDAMQGAPAVVHDGRLDLVGANRLGRALYSEVFDRAAGRPNLAHFLFLDPSAGGFFPDWETMADDAVSMLRIEAGHASHGKGLTDLIGELATRSDQFKVRWAAHDVRGHRRGAKRFHHPIVGPLTLHYEALPIPDAGGLSLLAYTAEPGSPSAEALALLASWTAGDAPSAPSPPGGDTSAVSSP